MQKEAKTYIHISTSNDKGEEKHIAQPEKAVQKMTETGEEFKQFSTLKYFETQFDSPQEFMDVTLPDGSAVSDDVKKDIINRGWVLFQQATAKALVLEDDEEFVNKGEQPVDISEVALSPKEKARKRGTPQTRARKSLRELMDEDPEGFELLIAEFRRENVGVVTK